MRVLVTALFIYEREHHRLKGSTEEAPRERGEAQERTPPY